MAGLSSLEWRIIAEEAHDGATAMALDEVAAETAADGGPATIRLFRWQPSTHSLGYSQDPETIDWDYCKQEGIGVTRRPTGGGAIYHGDDADLSYAIAVPADAAPGDLSETYDRFCEPIAGAFERLGVPVHFAEEPRPAINQPTCYLRALDPAHDLVGPDGRKVAGNAQFRRREAVVQHGSLSVSLEPERHCGCFSAELDPSTFITRVGAIEEYVDRTRADVVDAVAAALTEWADAVPGAWTDEERERAAEIALQKYGTTGWTRRGDRSQD
jgi:lipoate-protein ligase A